MIKLDRKHDEMVLGWISRRMAGQPTREIADACGVLRSQVSHTTNKVKAAHLAVEPQDVGEWW